MSFDFIKRLSPQPQSRVLSSVPRSTSPQPSPQTSLDQPDTTSPPPPLSSQPERLMSPPPSSSAPSPSSIMSPVSTSSESTSSQSQSQLRSHSQRASVSSPHQSPVDLFHHVDPRYPDIVATLSNALHYLNKSGFDHDVDHAQLMETLVDEGEEDEEISSNFTRRTAERNHYAVNIDPSTGLNGEEGDFQDGMITPGGSDSDTEDSTDDEHHLPRSPSTESNSSSHSSHHHRHHSHRRAHSKSMDVHPEVAEEIEHPHDSNFEQSNKPVLPSEFPEVEAVSSPVESESGNGDPLGEVKPQHGQTAPARASSTFPSSNTADLIPGSKSTTTTNEVPSAVASSAPLPSTSTPSATAPVARNIVGPTGEPLPSRDLAILSRTRHRHTQSEVPHFLSPHSVSGSTSPSPPRSPSPRSRSPSASPRRGSYAGPTSSSSASSADACPPGSEVDVKESTTTDVNERTEESETATTKTTVQTITTITTTTVVKTTTTQKNPIPSTATPPDTVVQWTSTEQSQLLEEILIFYVDLYWENQLAFAPFYKQKLDTWHDKALMIYRHLFQDEKFKSQSKKLLKAPLVEFFEEQLLRKSKELVPPSRSGLNRPYSMDDASVASSTDSYSSESDGSSLMSPPSAPVSTSSASPSGSAAPHNNLPVPTSASPPRRSSFSLLNPLNLFSSAPAAPSQEDIEFDAYYDRVNQVCGDLHKQFLSVSAQINRLLVEKLLSPSLPSDIQNANDLNRAMVNLLHAPQILAALSVYHPMYQDAVVNFPGRVLMSRTLRHRIESPSYLPIIYTDMIVAVNELTEILRKAFQKLASHHPHMIQRLVASKRLKSLRDLHAEARAQRDKKRDKGGYAESFSSWLYDSRVYPKLFSPSTFHMLQHLQIKDAKTFHLLSQHRLQEALWRLKDLDLDQEASALEKMINDEILGDQQASIAAVENLGGGFTTTKLINFPTQDIRGVYKPKAEVSMNNFGIQSIKDAMVSNYKKEIAAYRIDQLLKLNHVPITKESEVNGEKGSLQYFIQDANVARMINDVDVHNPTKSGKWTSSRGRAELPRSIKLFDWLINNRDRNLDNYLISDDGRVILIDHGWTFVAPTTAPTKEFLKKLIPKQSIYANVKALNDNEKLMDDELKDLLGPRNLAAFKGRLKTFVHFVEKRIAKKGREVTFRDAEREDWKPDLSR